MRNLFTLLLLFFTISTNAQHFEAGLSFGNANYLGDLVSTKNLAVLKQFNASTSIFARLNHKRFGTQLSLMHTTLSADDKNGLYPERGLHFKTPITELALTVDCGLTYWQFNYGDSYIEPYATAGLALYHFNPKAQIDGEWTELQPLGTEGQGLANHANPYSRTQIALIMGGGMKFKINQKLAIRTEFGVRKLFTDYIDDVSANPVRYVQILMEKGEDIAALSVPSINQETTDFKIPTQTRGGAGKDMYFVYQVSVAYTIGKDKKHNLLLR